MLAWARVSGTGVDYGQCTVPFGATFGVIAIAAGKVHSLALKSNGGVLAWGCVGHNDGQCSVPAAAPAA